MKAILNKTKHYAIRNPFMVGVGALALVGSCSMIPTSEPAAAISFPMPEPSMMMQATKEAEVTKAVASKIRPTTKMVDLSYMNSIKLGGIAGAYFGDFRDSQGNVIPVPDRARINFTDNLQGLWDRKLRINGVSGSTQKNAVMIVSRYRDSDPDYKGIRTFIKQVDQQAKFAHASVDFSALCQKMKIKDFQCATLSKVTGQIQGRQLVAYGMTEVMPTWRGDINYVILDTLLRNAGENYIQSIPALGDKLMSLGFYQFTSHAVYSVDTKEGASYVNQFVTDRGARIPGSVAALRGNDHHRAAFYFVTYNMGRLMQKLDDKETQTLVSGKCSTTSITQFMATAHHMPSRAISNAKRWIAGGCSKPIVDYMGDHLTEYATKTKNNLEELEKHK